MGIEKFPVKEGISYWRCNCGSLTCFARSDGDIECANSDCGAIHENGGTWRIPDISVPVERAQEEADLKIVDFRDPKLAKLRMSRIIEDDSVLAIVVVRDSGATSVWGVNFETDEQQAWIKSNMGAAIIELCKAGDAG